jgi:hypothetical protein
VAVGSTALMPPAALTVSLPAELRTLAQRLQTPRDGLHWEVAWRPQAQRERLELRAQPAPRRPLDGFRQAPVGC